MKLGDAKWIHHFKIYCKCGDKEWVNDVYVGSKTQITKKKALASIGYTTTSGAPMKIIRKVYRLLRAD